MKLGDGGLIGRERLQAPTGYHQAFLPFVALVAGVREDSNSLPSNSNPNGELMMQSRETPFRLILGFLFKLMKRDNTRLVVSSTRLSLTVVD